MFKYIILIALSISLIKTCTVSNCGSSYTDFLVCNCRWCNTGYWLQEISLGSDKCHACISNCNSCSNSSNCSTCRSGYGYISGSCQSCNASCSSCSGSVNTCTGCSNGSHLLGGGQCKTCSDWIPNCNTCTNYNTCASCASGYGIASDGSCVECVSPCSTCSGSGTSCTGCVSADYLFGNNDCQKCNEWKSNCTNCTDYNTCTSCESGHGLVGTSCVQCAPQCGECSGAADQCSTCKDSSFYFDSINTCKTCEDWKPNCNSCQDFETCLQCDTGYYLDNGSCVQCQHPCTECTSASDCTVCAPGDNRQGAPGCLCEAEFHDNANLCQACAHPCKECTSAFDCTVCIDGNNREDASLDCICKDGFVDYFNECVPCSPQCVGCTNNDPDHCQTCINSDNRGGAPACLCNDGYYDLNGVCTQCSPHCKTCGNGPDDCLTCQAGSFRDEIAPNCGCQDNFYGEPGKLNCQSCPGNCAVCSQEKGEIVCSKCVNELMALPDCTIEKKKSYNTVDINSGNQINLPCEKQCESCTSSSDNCTVCTQGKNRSLELPLCGCQPGYHDNGKQTSDCEKCPDECAICESSEKCLVCNPISKTVLNVFSQQCECQDGFKLNKEGVCQECFEFNDMCHFVCPQQSVLNSEEKICYPIQFVEEDNMIIFYLCGAGVVFTALAVSGFFGYLFKKRFTKKSYFWGGQQQQEYKAAKKDSLDVQSVGSDVDLEQNSVGNLNDSMSQSGQQQEQNEVQVQN